jgi:hypothetical protein
MPTVCHRPGADPFRILTRAADRLGIHTRTVLNSAYAITGSISVSATTSMGLIRQSQIS